MLARGVAMMPKKGIPGNWQRIVQRLIATGRSIQAFLEAHADDFHHCRFAAVRFDGAAHGSRRDVAHGGRHCDARDLWRAVGHVCRHGDVTRGELWRDVAMVAGTQMRLCVFSGVM